MGREKAKRGPLKNCLPDPCQGKPQTQEETLNSYKVFFRDPRAL
jgi:hypothetical protein